MADIRQSMRQEQTLALTPQLKKSLEILQAQSLELSKIIDQELKTNPMLEDMSAENVGERPETIGNDYEDYDFQNYRSTEADQRARDFFLNSIPHRPSLREYLLREANLEAESPKVAGALDALIGSMDERGFLSADALENARNEGFSETEIQDALKILRSAEPSGIGAFDMRDCLLIQLDRKGLRDSLAYKILDARFELLMRRRVAEIAELEDVAPEDVEDAISEIAKLNTSPASEFAQEDEKYISPDIFYKKDADGIWHAELSGDHIPKLRINPEYRQMMADGKLRKEEASYVKEKIRDGKFLMDSIAQRQKTLLRIGDAILERQIDFFEKGKDAVKPMTMQDVADMVELHPTTVGRAVSEKYAQTPYGLLPLKFFFSGGFEAVGGDSFASVSVKNKIKKIVEDESARAPLSDAKIADMLAEDGINIARRTVAKYREELGIAPKNLRKRF